MSIIAAIIGSSASITMPPEPGANVASLPTSQNSLRRAVYTGYHSEDPNYTYGKVPDSVTYTSSIGLTETGDDFTVEWTGWFYPPVTDNYRFTTASDDGSYMWIGNAAITPNLNNALVNNGGYHGENYASGSKVHLTAGRFYPIRVLFGEAGGGQVMTAYFVRDNNANEIQLDSYVYSEVPEVGLVANSVVYLDATTYGGSGDWINLGSNTLANADITTVTAAPVWSNSFGGIFTFNAPSLQYAQLPNLGTLSNFTISGWMRYTASVSEGACLITENYIGTTLNFSIGHLPGNPGDFDISGGIFDGSNWTHTAGPYPDLQKWYHYTMTFNGSNVLFYVNGRLYGTALYTSSPITTSGQPISIGRRWDNTFAQSSYINGDISIINVYDTCLNAAEVAQNFNYHKYTYGLNYTLSS